MSRRAAFDFTAARQRGAYSITLSCSPASCMSASAPASCDVGTGVRRPAFRSPSCSVRSALSLRTCAAASTRSARAARHASLKPSTSSRDIAAAYEASIVAGIARAGERFRKEKKDIGMFTVGSSSNSPSSPSSSYAAGSDVAYSATVVAPSSEDAARAIARDAEDVVDPSSHRF
jgi:hypothetical protein